VIAAAIARSINCHLIKDSSIATFAIILKFDVFVDMDQRFRDLHYYETSSERVSNFTWRAHKWNAQHHTLPLAISSRSNERVLEEANDNHFIFLLWKIRLEERGSCRNNCDHCLSTIDSAFSFVSSTLARSPLKKSKKFFLSYFWFSSSYSTR
jgi:hypothetical protein